jgi:hypothetical protein
MSTDFAVRGRDASENRSMSGAVGKNVETVPICYVKGNTFFEKTITVVGLDQAMMRWLLASVLNMIGSTPTSLTPDDLGILLPEIDRRLRKLVQPAQADLAMKRIFRVLVEQAELR